MLPKNPSAYSVPPCFKGFNVGLLDFVFIRVHSRLDFYLPSSAEICGEKMLLLWLNAER
jgi:hypothetical protein